MIEVEAPGGVIVEFPDGTPRDEMTRAMRAKFGGPAEPAAPAQVDVPGIEPQFSPQPVQPGLDDVVGAPRMPMAGAQGVGAGLADMAGLIPDQIPHAANSVLGGADAVSKAVGGPAINFRLPPANEAFKKAGFDLAQRAGLPVIPEDQMSLPEKAVHHGMQFATQGAVGAGALAKGARGLAAELTAPGVKPSFFDSLLRPYLKSPGTRVAGDTVVGGAGGTAVAGTQALPDSIRGGEDGTMPIGPLLDLAAMLVASHGAGVAVSAATKTPQALSQMVRNLSPADISIDPGTNSFTPNRTADMAARYVQGAASDPAKAAATIEEAVAAAKAEGVPVPTTGLISGDRGLTSLEMGQRKKESTGGTLVPNADPETKATYSYGARDEALRDQAVTDVNSIRPAGADPQAFPDRAAEIARVERETAQREVDRNAGAVRRVETAREGPAAELNANATQGEAASRNIDQTYRDTRVAERNQSNALFNDPVLTEAQVPAQPLVDTAQGIGATNTRAAPLDPVVQKYVDRFRPAQAADEAAGTPAVAGFAEDQQITMREVNALRAEVEADIAANLDNGQIVRQLREVKAAINTYATRLSAEGSPAGVAAAEASENFATRVAPNFREGAGGRVDKTLKNNDNAPGVMPSKMANNFLTRPEDTADLMRIARLGGNEANVAGQARTWLFDRLAQTGVARDGAIDPEKLTRWRNANAGVIREVPGLEAEVNGMVRDARRGAALNEQHTAALRASEQRATEVGRNIDQGPIGAVAGADPQKAVAAVFGHKNPEQAARELVATVGKNPEARAGMKAAFAEHFANKVSGVNPSNVSEGTQNINFAGLVKEFNKNRRVLAVVFDGPGEMNALERAQRMLAPLAERGAQATTGSITAESTEFAERALRLGLFAYYRSALPAGGMGARLKDAWKTLKGEADEIGANRLVARMMFDPELAGQLLTRKVAEVGTPAWNARLQKIIRRTEVAKQITAPEED